MHIVFITVDGEDAAFELCVIHGNKCCDLTTVYGKKYVSCAVVPLIPQITGIFKGQQVRMVL